MKFSLPSLGLLWCSAFLGEIASAYDVGNEKNDPTGQNDHSNDKFPTNSHETNLRGSRMTLKEEENEYARHPHQKFQGYGGQEEGGPYNNEPARTLQTCSYCGGGSVGNGFCEDGNCCSEHGWCGTTDAHCNGIRTCGGGSVGNGVCADNSLCCSEYGWCGTSDTHCGSCNQGSTGGSDPATPVPTNPNPTPPATGGGDESRLIAYVGNWQACPTEAQYSQYTHIVIAFAVSYQWSQQKNVCSETCDISTPPVCNNAANPQLIQQWQAAGIKVILSFGGAGMGGSWDGDVNDCWDHCFGRETQVVNRLTQIVNDMGLDGVDIDYEYFYENNQHNAAQRGFDKGSQAQTFLREVTIGLRNSLPTGSIVTHAPMDPDVVPGTAYYDVLVDVASSLDFLMPQYYNGYIRPVTDFAGALSHFSTLSNALFGGDPNKVVFGFCIAECGSYNVDGAQAADVINNLNDAYPCIGGAFFWVAEHDANGSWSVPVSDAVQTSTGSCSSGNTPAPAPAPTPANPAPVPAPVPAPSPAPVGGVPGNNCGIDWVDAEKCQTPCPNGQNSECPSDEKCWASITCS